VLFQKSKYIQKIKDSIYQAKLEKIKRDRKVREYTRRMDREKKQPLYFSSKEDCLSAGGNHDSYFAYRNNLCYADNFDTAWNICKKSGGHIPDIKILIHFAKKMGATDDLGWFNATKDQDFTYLERAKDYGIDIDDKMNYWAVKSNAYDSEAVIFDFEKLDNYPTTNNPRGVVCVGE